MVVMDILSKYAWLEPPKSKHDIAIKNALEHIFCQAIRRPDGYRRIKEQNFQRLGENVPSKKQLEAICNT